MWRALATKRVKEVRFLLNKAVPGTDAAAKFLQNNYAAIKKDNPALPILIRESKTVETAMMVTRFRTSSTTPTLSYRPVIFRSCSRTRASALHCLTLLPSLPRHLLP
jgi:hypothetical protein